MDDAPARLASLLRAAVSPEDLNALAVKAASEAATSGAPGVLLVAHAILLLCARRIEGEPLDEREWHSVRALLASLGDYLVSPDTAALNTMADSWRAWTQPPALH